LENLPFMRSGSCRIHHGRTADFVSFYVLDGMTESFSSILTVAGLALLVTFIWGATIAIVYWDTSRRGMSGWKQLLWLALAALLPVVGFFAYLFTRLLQGAQPPREGTQVYAIRRATEAKRPPQAQVHLPTIAGVDLLKQTSVQAAPPKAPPRRSPRPRYALEMAEGPHKGQRWMLDQLPIRVGRGSTAFIQLNNDLGVSRNHAEIYVQEGVFHVRDLQSTHGTYVNGKRIFDHSLNVGDEIQIGASTLALRALREKP
jgi:hypothetical protein